jgi:hypothetical protein
MLLIFKEEFRGVGPVVDWTDEADCGWRKAIFLRGFLHG